MRHTLLTCTGDRPEAFALCEQWMARQTRREWCRWVVVDDGVTPTVTTMGQEVIRLAPMQGHSLNRNLCAGLSTIDTAAVFIEDDDWYSPHYLYVMIGWLDQGHQIAGQVRALYYNVARRMYHRHGNTHHASLCQTAIRFGVIGDFLRELHRDPKQQFVDMALWHKCAGPVGESLFNCEYSYCVGIKGLPGRQGIGTGHRPEGYQIDHDGTYLREIVGDHDAEIYQRFVNWDKFQ